jgi:hypothetical protein
VFTAGGLTSGIDLARTSVALYSVQERRRRRALPWKTAPADS